MKAAAAAVSGPDSEDVMGASIEMLPVGKTRAELGPRVACRKVRAYFGDRRPKCGCVTRHHIEVCKPSGRIGSLRETRCSPLPNELEVTKRVASGDLMSPAAMKGQVQPEQLSKGSLVPLTVMRKGLGMPRAVWLVVPWQHFRSYLGEES